MMVTDETKQYPVVLSFAGHDPCGGAGIQADIEAIKNCHCHCVTVITALTVQDTLNVKDYYPLPETYIIEQARALLEDMKVAAFKIGMVGNSSIVTSIYTILQDYPHIPVVLDPIIYAGGGMPLVDDDDVLETLQTLLFPLTTILTPNSAEARILAAEADNLDACAQTLLEMGCEYVLIKGAHEKSAEVINTLYSHHRLLKTFNWHRLPHQYHGSGCTLSASIAAYLAQGLDPVSAVHEAQRYTFNSLKNSYAIGKGQRIPNRWSWQS